MRRLMMVSLDSRRREPTLDPATKLAPLVLAPLVLAPLWLPAAALAGLAAGRPAGLARDRLHARAHLVEARPAWARTVALAGGARRGAGLLDMHALGGRIVDHRELGGAQPLELVA